MERTRGGGPATPGKPRGHASTTDRPTPVEAPTEGPPRQRRGDTRTSGGGRPAGRAAAAESGLVGWATTTVTGADGGPVDLLVGPGPAAAGQSEQRPGATADLPPALLARPRLREGGTSVTLVLSGSPRPGDLLTDLVDRATVAFDVTLVPDDAALAAAGARPALVDGLTVELADGARPVLRSPTVTAFPSAAAQGTLDARDVPALVDALTGTGDLRLTALLQLPAPPGGRSRIRADLGRLWRALGVVRDEPGIFREADLRNYLSGWLDDGTVSVEAGPDDPAAVLAVVLKAARPVLAAAPDVLTPADGLGPAYRLSAHAIDQSVVVSGPAGPAGPSPQLQLSASVADLLGPLLAAGPERVLHAVTVDGGRVTSLLPARRVRATRDPAVRLLSLHVRQGDRIVGLTNAWGNAATYSAGAAIDPHAVHPTDVMLFPDDTPEPGPLLTDVGATSWADRADPAVLWFAPRFRFERPDPALPAEQGPFTFDVVPESGHTAEGQRVITATITMRLRIVRPPELDDTSLALPADVRPVPVGDLKVQLGVPFRDENGTALVEQIPATALEHDGVLAPGSTVTATFRLGDRWARLAYGALSTPGFQATPPALTVSWVAAGWRRTTKPPFISGLDKEWVLHSVTRRNRAWRPGLVATLPHAVVIPPWRLEPGVQDRWSKPTHHWITAPRMQVLEAVVPCAEHGPVYREQIDGLWQAIGCRPGMELGQARYVTYQPIPVAAAEGHARVYRSLRTPGRFLVMPLRYAVGRFEPDDPERAYLPTMLLQTTLDADDPTQIRCLLAASLEPAVAPHVRAAVLAELRSTAHPDPELEWLPATGAPPVLDWAVPAGVSVDTAPSARGFDLAVSTDIAGFLTCKALVERDGLRGSVAAELPGGIRLVSDLVVSTGSVTGPFDAGPVDLLIDRAGRAVCTNRVARRMALRGLVADGDTVLVVDRVLAPGEEVRLEPPEGTQFADGVLPVVVPEPGVEALEEVRAYIEDLRIGMIFVLTGELGAGVAGLEVRTRFDGHDDATPLTLSKDHREADRQYVLPLTAFTGDPVLDFQVVTVAPDGTRQDGAWTSWPLRSRGALVPVAAP